MTVSVTLRAPTRGPTRAALSRAHRVSWFIRAPPNRCCRCRVANRGRRRLQPARRRANARAPRAPGAPSIARPASRRARRAVARVERERRAQVRDLPARRRELALGLAEPGGRRRRARRFEDVRGAPPSSSTTGMRSAGDLGSRPAQQYQDSRRRRLTGDLAHFCTLAQVLESLRIGALSSLAPFRRCLGPSPWRTTGTRPTTRTCSSSRRRRRRPAARDARRAERAQRARRRGRVRALPERLRRARAARAPLTALPDAVRARLLDLVCAAVDELVRSPALRKHAPPAARAERANARFISSRAPRASRSTTTPTTTTRPRPRPRPRAARRPAARSARRRRRAHGVQDGGEPVAARRRRSPRRSGPPREGDRVGRRGLRVLRARARPRARLLGRAARARARRRPRPRRRRRRRQGVGTAAFPTRPRPRVLRAAGACTRWSRRPRTSRPAAARSRTRGAS